MSLPRLLVGCLVLAAVLPAQARLFDRVAETLADRYVDRAFRRDELPEIVDRYRPAAVSAGSRAEQRAVVHALLKEVPASHLALLSRRAYERLEAEVDGKRTPMLGFTLTQIAGRFYMDSVYSGGPADDASLRRGAEVIAIDGEPPGRSPLLGWRTDDAYLPDQPSHDLDVEDGQRVVLRIVEGGSERSVELLARPWSGLAASVNGVTTLPLGGLKALYVRLWYVYHGRAARLVRAALHDHRDCDGLVLDLRGRGGSALECLDVVRVLQRAHRRGLRIVALIDEVTRSAKEVIALELRRRDLAVLVGEHTAGAVLPATFVPVAHDAVLMLPESRLGTYSRQLEGRGVAPDVQATDDFPVKPGDDPILWAGLLTLEGILEQSHGSRSR